ncbi:MAG: metallophosphoesterase [Muribaculaceae bacterium]|nr:metallophosphoesterase [Muribaculaceae bacterium]MDE6610902.1 metallophosphoesterase [Muribaculaceae bacterium]
MDRREFISMSAASLAGLALFGIPGVAFAKDASKGPRKYSVVILGDTHFDTEPDTVYHSNYNEPVEWLNRVQRAEFARNGEMWRERCPRLLQRCADLVDKNTEMAFQMGDLIQGDCGKGEVHQKMLNDVMDAFKQKFNGIPFVTVVGNHDIRGVDAEKVYHEYMPKRMSQEIGKDIEKTTFYFTIGPDAFLVLDFNSPDDAEIEKMLQETKDARHTFIISHGPVFPMDGSSCRWFFHGGKNDAEVRRHFREEFAKRNAIVLCGHSHHTTLTEWKGDGGIITQMEMNSVWSNDERGTYKINTDNPADYGMARMSMKANADGSPIADESALFEEYRPGLTRYIDSITAGSFKLNVGPKHVTIDFYAGDSAEKTCTFKLR